MHFLVALLSLAEPASLSEWSARSDLVVWGRVERSWPQATRHCSVAVEQTFRGPIRASIELADCPSYVVGERGLFFIDSSLPDRWLLLEQAGQADVHVSVRHLLRDRWAVPAREDYLAQPVPVGEVLQRFGLPMLSLPPQRAGVLRETIECEPCLPELSVAAPVPAGARDCGDSNEPAGAACLAAELAARRPFVARRSWGGIDSEFVAVIIGVAGGGGLLVRHDSDTGGGLNKCMAAIFVERCSQIRLSHRGSVECIGSRGVSTACDEQARQWRKLDPLEPLEPYRCAFGGGSSFAHCSKDPLLGKDRPVKLTPADRQYICVPTRDEMTCRPAWSRRD